MFNDVSSAGVYCMPRYIYIIHCLFSRFFQRKISANRLALVGMAGGRAGGRTASTIRVKVLVSDNDSDFF